MATRTVKAKVEIDGEDKYKQAISELNKGNAVLGSEMRKLQAEFKGNTESTEFLTKKGELLERQLLEQKNKIQTLREALANAAQQYGESSDKTQDWQIKLKYAEAAQYNLEAAIRENQDALQGANQEMQNTKEAMKGLGDTVGDLTDRVGVKLPDGARKALNGMQSLSGGTVAAMGAAVWTIWHFAFGDPGQLNGFRLTAGILLCVGVGMVLYALLALKTGAVSKEDLPGRIRRFLK